MKCELADHLREIERKMKGKGEGKLKSIASPIIAPPM
jgi:hypothetical protein